MFNRVGVIGDNDSVLAFKAVGVEVFGVSDAYSARDTIRRLIKEDFAVLFITEDYAQENEDLLEKVKSKPFPAIVPIPTSKGSTGFGLAGVKKDVEKALGVDILFEGRKA